MKETDSFVRDLILMRIPLARVAIGLLFTCFAASGADSPRFIGFSSGQANVVISQDGADYLTFGTAVWGPNWAWTGVEGASRSDAGATVGTLSMKVAGKPLGLAFRAERASPNQLQLSYELKAETEADLTLFVVELTPGRAFRRSSAMVVSDSKTNSMKMPFSRGVIGEKVSSIQITDSKGGRTTLRFEPACEITSDGAARIVMAKDHMAPGTVKQRIYVDLPSAVQWYPSVAEIPDEPGITEWYPWRGTGVATESFTSIQDWLEKPAGKHGRIIRKSDKLVYNDQPIKLWGLNLCYGTCAPEKALADKRAAFYSAYGVNAVRLHKYVDNTGWSGIQAKDTCVEFDPQALDRMDYQVAKFKEAGIYVELSAHFGSLRMGQADKKYVPFMEEFGAFRDGRIETPHSAVHYSPELQNVQILQTVNLLKHRNPYTGMTYAEDPAVAFIEVINEQSILFYSSMEPLKRSATLRKQIGAKFCDWLRTKYGTQDKLTDAWGKAAFDCFASDGFSGEDLAKGNILPLGNPWYWDPDQIWGSQANKRQRLLDSLKFLYGLECEFYDRYVEAMREAGYAGEIVGSNWQAGRAYSHFANLHADARVGTVDRHNYFGGEMANASLLERAGSGLLSSGMQQVSDRPFMLSEWIHVYPSEMGVEGPAVIGAYGMGLQGWDVSFMFQNGDNGAFSERIGRDQWDVTAPQVIGVFPAVAREILRGDVSESDKTVVRKVHVPSLFEGKLGFDDKVVQGYDNKELDSSKVPARALAAVRSVVEFTDTPSETAVFDLKPYERDGEIVASTGQLRWREADGSAGGAFMIDTPGTKGVVGFAESKKYDLGDITIEPGSRFSAIYVTAREKNRSIEASRELLVAALARARNTNMKFSPNGDRLLSAGSKPILMEPVKATLTLKKQGAPTVHLLDHDGKLTGQTLPVQDGKIVIDGARDKTPYYLIRY